MTRAIAVIGGGAAGVFAAIAAVEVNPRVRVTVFESTGELLDKVRVSGGGRCNVTHHCFDPAALVAHYPRGARELRGPFSRFQPQDTAVWFERHGVPLKIEPDGRMFPITDSSRTITACLLDTARSAGVEFRLHARVRQIETHPATGQFTLSADAALTDSFDRVLIATGSSSHGHQLAADLGHSIIPCVPSLFTFKINDPRLADLAGISFDSVVAALHAGESRLAQSGPMLITHWGMSGPVILRLSAWGARLLHDHRYRAMLRVNFVPELSPNQIENLFTTFHAEFGKRQLHTHGLPSLPRRYWAALVRHARIDDSVTWSSLTRAQMKALVGELTDATFEIRGRGIFKDEFVTCGGVALDEVDFKTMQSRVQPGLYFAGEVLDIDGITGGFNFQSAWTTGWVAGRAMAD